jgi:RNA polymerase sigma-70 factor (ECF subfamily)
MFAYMNPWAACVRHLKQILRRRGRSADDADDLVQEAFLRLHAFMSDGKEVRQPEAFLVRTVLNLSVDQRRRARGHLYESQPVEEMQLVDLAPTPEEEIAAEQRLARIRHVLDTEVSARTREVYLQHRLDGFTYEEIAQRMHMSVRTVEKHIARAVTALWAERERE